MNNLYRKSSINQSKDIESQMPERRRTSPAVNSSHRITSETGHYSKSNDRNFVPKRRPSLQKTKINCYEQKLNVYNFLHRHPRGLLSIGYNIFVTCIVFTCLALTVLSTIPGIKQCFISYQN